MMNHFVKMEDGKGRLFMMQCLWNLWNERNDASCKIKMRLQSYQSFEAYVNIVKVETSVVIISTPNHLRF